MADFLVPGSDRILPEFSSPGGQRGYPGGYVPSANDAGGVGELLGVLRRHLLLVVSVTAAVTAIAGVLAYRSLPVFQSVAVIRITDNLSAMTAGLDNGAASGAPGLRADPVSSQIHVLKSRAIAAQVVARHPLGLRVVPTGFSGAQLLEVSVDSSVESGTLELEFLPRSFKVRGRDGAQVRGEYGKPALVDGVAFTLDRAPVEPDGQIVIVPTEEAVNAVVGGLDARVRRNSDVIDVTYRNSNPQTAREVVNVVVTTFQSVSASLAKEASRRRREFVQEQMVQTDSMLAEAQLVLGTFASKRQVYGSERRIAAEATGLMSMDIRRGELSADRTVYQALLDSLSRAGVKQRAERLNTLMSSPGLAQNAAMQGLVEQLGNYMRMRDSATTGPWASAPDNPELTRLDALIAATQTRLISATRSQVNLLDARIAALDALKNTTAAELRKLPATQAAEARLLQHVEAARKVSDQLSAEFQKARIAEAVEAGQVEVVDLSSSRPTQLGRTPRFKTLVGLLLGLMLGIGAAFKVDHLDSSIQSREEVEGILQVPGLAIIPKITLPRQKDGWWRRGLGAPSAVVGRKGVPGRDRAALVTTGAMNTTGAEAYRTLRTSLIFSQRSQTLRTLVVTSAAPDEGKTTTATNLAVSFAQQGMRVLLVDCDLRRSRLHSVFGLPREPGLTTALFGKVPLEDAVRKTKFGGLSVLVAGQPPANPAELLGGQQMQVVLSWLAERYDIILLDTPPVQVVADALILGQGVDGVLLVLRAGKTPREVVRDTIHSLSGVGARVVGVVLNDPDQKVTPYAGSYGYRRYYESASKGGEA